jgi:hypothetical protein
MPPSRSDDYHKDDDADQNGETDKDKGDRRHSLNCGASARVDLSDYHRWCIVIGTCPRLKEPVRSAIAALGNEHRDED